MESEDQRLINKHLALRHLLEALAYLEEEIRSLPPA